MRGKRGRPPKPLQAEEPSPSTARGLRPRRNVKPRVRDSGDEDVESPTRDPPKPSRKRKRGSVTSTRGRGRGRGGGARGGRGDRGGRRPAASKAVVYDDHESEEEDDAVSLRSEEDEYVEEEPQSEEDEALKDESDCLEEDVLDEVEDDDASYCTESSFRSQSTHASTPGKGDTVVSAVVPCLYTQGRCKKKTPTCCRRRFLTSVGSSRVIVQNGECTMYEHRPQSSVLLQVDRICISIPARFVAVTASDNTPRRAPPK